jgi:hypothetical protein
MGEDLRISIEKAIELTGRNRRALQSLAATGKIPGAAKIGRVWTFNLYRLRRWIRQLEAESCKKENAPRGMPTGAARSCGAGSWSEDKSSSGAYERTMQLLRSGASKSVVNGN